MTREHAPDCAAWLAKPCDCDRSPVIMGAVSMSHSGSRVTLEFSTPRAAAVFFNKHQVRAAPGLASIWGDPVPGVYSPTQKNAP